MQERFDLGRRTVVQSLGILGAGGLGLGSTLTGTASAYDSALESYYDLDGTDASDSSGNGNDGTVDGASAGGSGIANGCFSFDGTDDTIDVPHALSGATSGSYSVWVNADRLDEDKAILGDWPDADLTLWYDVDDDVWGFAARFDGTIRKVTGGSPTAGEWGHLAVTYDGTVLTLYVDGTEVDANSVSGSLASETDIQLGGDNGDHNYWHGRIDEVRTYSRALSPTEVSELYADPGSAAFDGTDTVTDIEYANQGLAFEPSGQNYSPGDEFMFPSIIETSNVSDPLGKYHLYCAPHGTPETKDGETVGIALFYSDTLGDGSWTEYAGNPIIDPSDFAGVSHISSPHAIYADEYGKVLLYAHGNNDTTRWWYCSGGDGATFDYGGIAVDTAMFSGSSEASYARVYEYSIPNRSNRYTMFFMDNQSGTRHIRLATSDDGKNWTVDSEPVITPQPEHDGNVSGPFFFRYDGAYCLAFHASDGNQWVAEVGENVDREDHLGTFNQATSGDPDNGRCSSPFLVKDDDGQPWMYYESDDRLAAAVAVENLTDPDDAANLDLFDLS
ncbi:LamG-like jellyroll fold domain-containing protein [Halosolutus gelatinilyticus]|uniref:LamG-like jellyroll fold domain-containing protein n=1 Tax=Halosolutus gelatinilyticus TaxID=2931975 RepID=UPI001FF51201|nr:LamG-like jellyroll fold domain-containing protein [Halosolutus gelatinilyticus]